MKMTIFALMMAASSLASADGFVCETDAGLKLKVYNHTSAAEGTRNAAVLVVSDASVAHGRKTIAKFTDVAGTLSQSGTVYTAKVDLRFNDSSRQGEWIGGTKLGELAQIKLSVAHNYLQPLADGETAYATAKYIKRNGEVLVDRAICTRYLKQAAK